MPGPDRKKIWNPHAATVHLSVVLFSCAGIFAKWLTLTPVVITFGRVLFSTLSLAAFLALKRQSFRPDKKTFARLAALGALLAVHWVLFFAGIQASDVTTGLLTTSCFPIFTLFLEPLTGQGRIRLSQVLFTLLAVAGVALVALKKDNLGVVPVKGIVFGLAAGFAYACIAVFNRLFVLSDIKPQWIILYEHAVAGCLLLPFALYRLQYEAVSVRDILLLAVLGIVCTALGHTLFTTGLAGLSVHSAGIITCLEPVYGIAVAAITLREPLSLQTLLGGALILAASMTSSGRQKKKAG